MAKTKKLKAGKPRPAAPDTRLAIPGVDELNEPPVNLTDYCITIFGEKGVGKTSLISQFPGIVVGMSEPRRRNLKIRMVPIAAKSIREMKREEKKNGSVIDPWLQTKQLIEDIITDDSVQGFAADTVDRFYEMCFNSHCFNEGINDPSDKNDYGAGWRAIADDFEETFNRVLYAEKTLILVSHAHLREVETRDGSEGYDLLIPTCPKAAFRYIKAASDFAFYYGYYQRQRAMYLRGTDHIWCACGVDDHFLSPTGTPLNVINMGSTPQEGYTNLQAAYANDLEDLFVSDDEDKEEEVPTPRKKKRKAS